jgi:hypothetical protein
MPKLNDTQLILLATAAQRDARNFLPLPTALAAGTDRAAKAIAALIKRGLAEDREATDPSHTHRTDCDLRYGAYATDAGIAALDDGKAPALAAPPAISEPRVTKSSVVVDLLRRPNGATLAELLDATNWLPHTTRAALTGLRKKGHAIERTKRDDQTCYRIAAA